MTRADNQKIRYSEFPFVCEEDGTEMRLFTDAKTGKHGWHCNDCGWEFLEEEME